MEEFWSKSNVLTGYSISDTGRVRSKDGNILKPRDNGRGYLNINVNNKTYYIHRLVADAFLTTITSKDQVNHIDGNKLNNNISNLEWVTAKENIQHATDTGLKDQKGDKSVAARLTNEDAINIVNDKRKQRDIAVSYGVCFQKISDIKSGRLYSIATGIEYKPKKRAKSTL